MWFTVELLRLVSHHCCFDIVFDLPWETSTKFAYSLQTTTIETFYLQFQFTILGKIKHQFVIKNYLSFSIYFSAQNYNLNAPAQSVSLCFEAKNNLNYGSTLSKVSRQKVVCTLHCKWLCIRKYLIDQ